MIPSVGKRIKVTFPEKPYDVTYYYIVVDDNVKDDGRGTVKLQRMRSVEVTTRTTWDGLWWDKPAYSTPWCKKTHRKFKGYHNEDGSKKMKETSTTEVVDHEEDYSVVDRLWFDQELTGRKIEVLEGP